MMYQSKKKLSNPTYLHLKIPIVVLDYQPTILTNQIKKEGRKESPKWDSNTRPAAYEADALPTELLRRLSSLLRTGVRVSGWNGYSVIRHIL